MRTGFVPCIHGIPPQSTVRVKVTLWLTPIETAVTGIKYVPVAVEPVLPVEPVPPPPPPDFVQLDTVPTKIANSASSSRAFWRRIHPSGNSNSPQTSGRMRHRVGFIERGDKVEVVPVVEIVSAISPVAPSLSVSVDGLKTQSASVGSVPHTNANVPDEAFSGVTTSA